MIGSVLTNFILASASAADLMVGMGNMETDLVSGTIRDIGTKVTEHQVLLDTTRGTHNHVSVDTVITQAMAAIARLSNKVKGEEYTPQNVVQGTQISRVEIPTFPGEITLQSTLYRILPHQTRPKVVQ